MASAPGAPDTVVGAPETVDGAPETVVGAPETTVEGETRIEDTALVTGVTGTD